jgi:peptidoglycan hydrolase-like protein with peptidoglycan-binding domain
MAVTNLEVQTELKRLGHYSGDLDGLAGPETAKAVVAFQESKGLPATGKLDPKSLAALFPGPVAERPKTIKGMFSDYVLNLVKSKANWAAAAMVATLVAFLNTKFGFQIDAQTQAAMIVVIAGAFASLIGVLQTFFNSPHMTLKQPSVVMKPAEFTGQEKK